MPRYTLKLVARLTGSTPTSPRIRGDWSTGAFKSCWKIRRQSRQAVRLEIDQWSVPIGDDKGWIIYGIVDDVQLVILLRFLPGLD